MDHLKRVEEEFTRQADTFDAHAVKADDQVAARFQEAMGSAGSGTVLDVACGPGVVTAALAGKAQAVTAFDATPAMLEKARKRCAEAGLQNVQFKQGNAASLPFDSGAFDGVVTRLAIHHFPDPKRVLKEIFRVLRPGGTVVIAERGGFGRCQRGGFAERHRDHSRPVPHPDVVGLQAGCADCRYGVRDQVGLDLGQIAGVRGMDGDRQ